MPASPLVKWFPKLGEKPAGYKKIELDEVGSFVWDMCDGETPVSQMIDALIEAYKLNPKEAEVALLTFVKTLLTKNLASVVIPAEEE